MLALRKRPIAALSRVFWLSTLCAALAPTSIGYQDLAAFLARQPGISARWRDHLIASPFGTIHAATFSFSRPIGTSLSEPIGAELVNYDPRALDVKVWTGTASPLNRPALHVAYPSVNRRLKGDRMPLAQPAPTSSGTDHPSSLQPVNAPATMPALPQPGARPKSAERLEPPAATTPTDASANNAAGTSPPDDVTGTITPTNSAATAKPSITPPPGRTDAAREADSEDDAALADKPPEIPAPGESEQVEQQGAERSPFASPSFLGEDPAERETQLYFSGGVMGERSGLQQWPLGAEPVLVSPPPDPDIKLSALEPKPEAGPGGETIAGKDAAGQLVSPAERLGLEGKPRAKAEKCLADAVYFEARGEPLRGQMAVAQVVMNRVFSGYYPNNVCGVVYQNANRHLACQFTFACEGKDLSRIDEADMWEQAKHIAKDMLDGKIWLTEVGHATHYHAYWVHPSWVHEMKKMYKLGVHTFYRPRAWGDGSDAPVWGAAPEAGKEAPKETPKEAPKPAATSALDAPPAKDTATVLKSPEAAAKMPQVSSLPLAGTSGKAQSIARL